MTKTRIRGLRGAHDEKMRPQRSANVGSLRALSIG
jgi:hypothetical protein